MKWLRNFLLLFFALGVVCLVLAAHYYYKGFYRGAGAQTSAVHATVLQHATALQRVGEAENERLAQKASALRQFLAHGHVNPAGRSNPAAERFNPGEHSNAAERFNPGVVFFVDMRLPSGRNRFFVYDLSNDSILQAGLVAHGCGNSAFSFSPSFSNSDGSNCSALGRYRIGGAYMGHFGRSYLLYGLDSTNSHAFDRHIVLHAYDCVPEGETDPYPICNSRGCAMLSPGFLKRLEPVIDRSPRPILLWIFD